MAKDKKKLSYRPCVGVMLLNKDNHAWIGRRLDAPNEEGGGEWWQMPQGGIDKGEDPAKAALRELYEETSVQSAKIIAEAPEWYKYDLPKQLIGKSWKGKYRGQTQKWFALRFTGREDEINLKPPGHKQEFAAWRWAPMDEVLGSIVAFKRPVYEKVIAAFRHLETK
jgi:putative (di)nucleoside polyphosphate hydrolase